MSKISRRQLPPHHGVLVRLAPSKTHGVGVFAIRFILKGTYVFFGDNDELVWIKKAAVRKTPREIQKLYRDFCVSRGDVYGCPDNFNHLTPAWYLNHSKKANVAADKEIRFYAVRDIRKGEELTADYSTYGDGSFRSLRP